MSGSPRILVLRGGAIGDFVVTLPVFQALKKKWPGADIEIWGYPHIAELAVEGGLAARVVSLDRAAMAKFYLPVPSWSEEQEAEVRGFDLILNYLHDPEGQIKSNLLLAGARKVLSGSPIIKRGAASRFLMEPLMDLGLYGESDVPELAPGAARMEEGRRALAGEGRSMVIHPGSGGAAKKWPMNRFLEVAGRLESAGWRVFWSFGEADDEEREVWRAAGGPGRELEAGALARLAAVLAHAWLNAKNAEVEQLKADIRARQQTVVILAAARALMENTALSAPEIAEKALRIAASICVFTNDHIRVEVTDCE